MFLKEKQDRSRKGRGVADGRKKWDKIEPKDATSPTVLMEAVMLTEKNQRTRRERRGVIRHTTGIFERGYG